MATPTASASPALPVLKGQTPDGVEVSFDPASSMWHAKKGTQKTRSQDSEKVGDKVKAWIAAEKAPPASEDGIRLSVPVSQDVAWSLPVYHFKDGGSDFGTKSKPVQEVNMKVRLPGQGGAPEVLRFQAGESGWRQGPPMVDTLYPMVAAVLDANDGASWVSETVQQLRRKQAKTLLAELMEEWLTQHTPATLQRKLSNARNAEGNIEHVWRDVPFVADTQRTSIREAVTYPAGVPVLDYMDDDAAPCSWQTRADGSWEAGRIVLSLSFGKYNGRPQFQVGVDLGEGNQAVLWSGDGFERAQQEARHAYDADAVASTAPQVSVWRWSPPSNGIVAWPENRTMSCLALSVGLVGHNKSSYGRLDPVVRSWSVNAEGVPSWTEEKGYSPYQWFEPSPHDAKFQALRTQLASAIADPPRPEVQTWRDALNDMSQRSLAWAAQNLSLPGAPDLASLNEAWTTQQRQYTAQAAQDPALLAQVAGWRDELDALKSPPSKPRGPR